jgi:hypothetical protein
MAEILLTRDQFREAVLKRDGYRCVICRKEAQDAHHILERRLFSNGGYFIENGASVCGECHISAEKTTLSCDDLRRGANIQSIVLPEHFYRDTQYDKWGNPILESGRRLRGELFEDQSVQKILSEGGVLALFDARVKYPRTWHLPWSASVTKDDRVLPNVDHFKGCEVIITEKMDGENASLYRDYIHARSLDYSPHPSRNYIKTLWGQICYNIPAGWRVCGENLYAKHSIFYEDLADYFQVFSVWNEHNVCLSWNDTVEWAELLGVKTVPVINRLFFNQHDIESTIAAYRSLVGREMEGYVVRLPEEFAYRAFRLSVAKWVRQNHVATHAHWMRQLVTPNRLRINS